MSQKQPQFLGEAATDLFEFALLFLAFHDNETDDNVTIRTLEYAARAAIAKAEGKPCNGPMTSEMIQKLKDDYLAWTGGFAPDDDEAIFSFIELGMQSGPDPEEARFVLRQWMNQTGAEEILPTEPLILNIRRKSD
jgi:hypothetical protein